MSSYIITSGPHSPDADADAHLGQLLPRLGADVLGRHLRKRGHRVRHIEYCGTHPCPSPDHAAAECTTVLLGDRPEETLSLGGTRHDRCVPALTAEAHTERVQRSFLRMWEAGVWEERELPGLRCGPCGRNLHETEVRGRCRFCAALCDGMYCQACERPQDVARLAALRCALCGAVPTRCTMRRIVLPLEHWREQLAAYHAMEHRHAQDQVQDEGRAEWQRPALHEYLSELFSRELPVIPVSREAGQGIPVPLAGWAEHDLDGWFSEAMGYAEAVTTLLDRVDGGEETSELRSCDRTTWIIDFAAVGQAFSHAALRPVVLLAQGICGLPHLVVGNEAARSAPGTPPTVRSGGPMAPPNADALRFHLGLTGSRPERHAAWAQEYADTIATVLAGGLEAWTDTILDLLAEGFGSVVPATSPAGPPVADRRELMRCTERALAAETFSLQRAAEALATAVDRAVADLRQLRPLRAERRYDAYAARLVAHTELLASCVVAAAPLMPGWSAFLAGHLGIDLDERSSSTLSFGVEADRLMPAGVKLPESVPVYFHEQI